MKLLTEFGCTQLVEDWFPGEPIAPGALHLTHATPAEVETNLGNQARREVMIVGRGW